MKAAREWPLFAYGVVIWSAALAVLIAFWQAYGQQLEAERRFSEESQRVTSQVAQRLRLYEYALRGARGSVLSAGPHLTRQIFRTYFESRDPAREFPGMRGIGFIRRVPVAAESEFLDEARRDGWPEFAIRQLIPSEGERYIIQYVEPIATNRAAVGLDIASEDKRRATADESAHTGQAHITPPITLVQATGNMAQGFLLLLPIYQPEGPPHAPRPLIGWTYGALVINEVLSSVDLQQAWFDLTLRDPSSEAGPFFRASDGEQPAAKDLVARIRIPVYGRVWEAEVRAKPGFVAALNQYDPRLTGALGIALALLLGVLTAIYEQATERAAQIRAEQARRAVIVETSTDAIIGLSPTGHVVDWNQAAVDLFGYPPEEALGSVLDELIVVEEERASMHTLRSHMLTNKQSVGPFEAVRRARDGTLIDVTASASPISDPRGNVLGIAIILRDAREAKAAARRVLELNANLEKQVEERTALLESAYRENEALLRTLNAHAIVSIADASGHIIDVNEAFCRVSGYTRKELLGKTHAVLASDQHAPEFYETLRSTLEAGLPWRGEMCHRAKDESLYWVDVVIAPFFDKNGVRERIVAIATDITATKRAEQRLRANQAFLDRVGRVAGVGGWELDVRRRTIHWSDETKRIHEVAPDYDPQLENALRFYPGQASVLLQNEIKRVMLEGGGYDVEIPFVSAQGVAKWVRTVGVAELEDGNVVRIIGALQDVSERKRADKLLQEANERFEIAADAAGIAVWDLDLGSGRLLCDDRMYELYGCERNAMDARAMIDARVHPDDRPRVAEAAAHSVRTGEPLDDEFRVVWPDGDVRHIKTNARVNYDETGKAVRIVGVNMDITERTRAELALRSATQKAEQANVAKSQFLANMSHEIRTPMNAVIGFSYLLRKTALSDEQQGLLAKIESASKSLLSVINDVLDLSKIEAGELVVENARFQLDDLLRGLTDIALVQADVKGIAYALDVDGDVPRTLEGDVTRLNQVLTNLLSNAVKFTEKGGVTLRVRRTAHDPERSTLRFTVEDTGIGIPPEVQPRLFAAFAQADASTTRKFGGTGLGLSIVKRLTELMGGVVHLESTPGVGSAFSVELSFGALDAHENDTDNAGYDEHASALRGIRVLVVDDSYVNMEMVKRILEAKGAIVELSGNGREAVDHLARATVLPDIVLMDVHMPVLDGHQATHRIRTELGLTELPIIALTAGALTTERQRALTAGMNDFLTKPFDTRDLVRVIRRHAAPADEVCAVPTPLPPQVNAVDWPKIRGIDAAEVRTRLGGDLALFASMLERLLAEFDDVRLAGRHDVPLKEHAARMHKLRGSAGMLAAKLVRDMAAQAEAACRSGDVEAATRLSERLAEELRQLRESALPQLRANQRAASEPRYENVADDLEVLSKMVLLVQALRQHDLAAVEQFEAISPQLRARLDHDSFLLLRGYIQSLRFTDAAGIIQGNLDSEQDDVPRAAAS